MYGFYGILRDMEQKMTECSQNRLKSLTTVTMLREDAKRMIETDEDLS
jgi:hypothetical protein